MKRCPQCDFIYEDEQSLCDMDGVLLVFDSRVLPNMHALAPIEAPVVATKSPWRHRTFPAVAALILATVFSLVYFVSTQRTMPSPSPASAASIMPAASEPAPVAESNPPSDSNQAAPAPSVEQLNTAAVAREEERKPESTKASTTHSTKKTTAPTSERKPAADEKKEESKVGSLLKKTGRILKKPFKF